MTKKRARVEVAAASGLAPFPAYFPSGFVPKVAA